MIWYLAKCLIFYLSPSYVKIVIEKLSLQLPWPENYGTAVRYGPDSNILILDPSISAARIEYAIHNIVANFNLAYKGAFISA